MRRRPLRGRPHLRSGSLTDLPFGQLLYAYAAERRTLCLEICRQHIRKTIVLEDGSPVDCRSNLFHETLGGFLVRRGRVSQFQYEGALAHAAERGVRTGEVLIELGLLDAGELQTSLQASLGRKLLECFTWQDGEFRVLSEPFEAEIDGVAEIKIAQLLFTGFSRFSPDTHVSRGVGALIGKDLILADDPPIGLDGVQLSSPQQRLINCLRRPVGVEDLLEDAGMSKAELLRTLYALSMMELVSIAAREGERPVDAPIVEGELPTQELIEFEDLEDLEALKELAEPDAKPHEQNWVDALRRQIAREYDRFRDLDPSALFSGAPDRRRRYVELCDHYAPSRFEMPELAEVMEMATVLLSLTVRGYEALKKPRESRTPELPMVCITELSAEDQAELAIEYDELGREQLLNGNFGAAGDLLDLAANCDPDNAAHAVDLAYARFREDPERAQQSLDELLALSHEGGYSSPLVYLYCAEISSSLGDVDAAATFFHTGCELWNGLLTYRLGG